MSEEEQISDITIEYLANRPEFVEHERKRSHYPPSRAIAVTRLRYLRRGKRVGVP